MPEPSYRQSVLSYNPLYSPNNLLSNMALESFAYFGNNSAISDSSILLQFFCRCYFYARINKLNFVMDFNGERTSQLPIDF